MIETLFQNYLTGLYGDTMLSKTQTVELRLAFIAGILTGYNLTMEAACQSTDEGELVIALRKIIDEEIIKANQNR